MQPRRRGCIGVTLLERAFVCRYRMRRLRWLQIIQRAPIATTGARFVFVTRFHRGYRSLDSANVTADARSRECPVDEEGADRLAIGGKSRDIAR